MSTIFSEFEDFPYDELDQLSQSQSQSTGSEYDPEVDGASGSNYSGSQFSCDEQCLGNKVEHQKVLVYLSSLLTLLSICRVPNCGSLVAQENMKISRNGAMITVHSTCNNHHSEIWESSPRIGTGKGAVALVNIHLAVYSLLVGLHIKQVLDFFGQLDIYCFGARFYYNLQESIVEKIVWMTWLFSQKGEIDKIKTRQADGSTLNCSGDGQFDSPGFTAAICTYTVQDLHSNAVIGLYVAHKHQCKSSAEMEVYACKTLLMNLTWEHGVQINTFTTDRSSSIKMLLSGLSAELPPNHPIIQHFYDIWHFIKSILKDLFKACKLKSCSGLSPWIPSISNMLWYSFSSSIGNHKLLKEKILSIPDHISNTHVFPSNTDHKACNHPPLTGDRSKAWLSKDSMEIQKIRSAILGKANCRIQELPHMLGFTHTGPIESWNSLHNHYANKNFSYGHSGMFVRGALAAIDNNSNLDRLQAKGKNGSLQFDLVSNRAGSKWFVRPRMEQKDDSWREAIVNLVVKGIELRKRPKLKIPVAGLDDFVRGKKVVRPDKMEAICKHQTRMLQNANL